ncbi:MAG: hypothetical protein Q8R11_00380 [bacterium]|nr:hypothetical protein [bacterium]
MATLHQSAQTARQLALTLLVGGLIFAIGKVVWDIGWQVYREKNPIPLAAPETEFGRLPNANIGQGIIPEIPFRYTLDTIDGRLPQGTPSAVVFHLSLPPTGFLTQDRAQVQAGEWGFTTNPERVGLTSYKWKDDAAKAEITIDGLTGSFAYKQNVFADPTEIARSVPTAEEVRAFVSTLLSRTTRLGDTAKPLLTEYLDMEKSSLTFVRSDGSEWSDTILLSQAQGLRVTVPYRAIGGVSVLPVDPKKPLVSVVVVAGRSGMEAAFVLYTDLAIDEEDASTYPLKTPAQAWRELNGGRAILVRTPTNGVAEVRIENIFLGYVVSGQKQEFLQPLYVFTGEDFQAYLPAIPEEWLLPRE